MTTSARQAGSGAVEYVALIGAVIAMFLGLLELRPTATSRRAPVDVITPVARLLGRPLDPSHLRASPAPRSVRPRPTAPRRRPADLAPIVMLPRWWR